MPAFHTNCYTGEFTATVDSSRRLRLPAKWRVPSDGEADFFLIALRPEGCLWIIPPPEQIVLLERFRSQGTDPEAQAVWCRFLAEVATTQCDSRGRIALPSRMLVQTQILKQARLVGMGASFQIWNTSSRQCAR